MKAKEMLESAKKAGKEIVARGAKNRTGAALSPELTAEMERAAEAGTAPPGDGRLMTDVRIARIRDAEPLGSVPPPVRPKKMVGAAARAARGENVAELIDRLGARLAFERAGVRLYDALLAKMLAGGALPKAMTRARVEAIRAEEASHIELVRRAILELGGDPTVVTPAADVTAVMSMGLPQVVQDPRTTVAQCLEAILVAELADNDGWAVLIDVAGALGEDDMVERFEGAQLREREHLADVRAWVASCARVQAGSPAARA